MRTYKFRGKRMDNGEWVYGFLVIDESGANNIVSNYSTSYSWDEVEPETVGQFVGLQDKNGKEIYEGDIIKQIYHAERGNSYNGDDESFDGHHIGRVVITSSKGVCMKKPLHYSEETDETTTTNQYKNVSGRRCEVIGNIHDNPELLEVKPNV